MSAGPDSSDNAEVGTAESAPEPGHQDTWRGSDRLEHHAGGEQHRDKDRGKYRPHHSRATTTQNGERRGRPEEERRDESEAERAQF